MDGTSFGKLSYVKFLNFVKGIRGILLFPTLEADEEKMLNHLAIKWSLSRQVSVADVMRSISDSSRSTTYRRITALQNKGLLTMVPHDTDHRIKLLLPTSLSVSYLRKMSECLDRAYN